jgi:hypothetical protein
MSGYALAWVSLAILVGFVATWFTMMRRVQVERVRWLLRPVAGVVITLAVFAFVREPGMFGGILAGVSLAIASAFLILSSMAAQSAQSPALAVGDPILEFSATDENGEIFDSASLRGRPVLLKFFRGHW